MAERMRGAGGFSDGPLRALPGPGAAPWIVPAAVNAWGPWTVVAADSGPLDAYAVGLYIDNLNAAAVGSIHVVMAAGPAGAAEAVAAWRPGRLAAGQTLYLSTGYPLRVRAGSRIAFAAAAAVATNLAVGVAFMLMGASS